MHTVRKRTARASPQLTVDDREARLVGAACSPLFAQRGSLLGPSAEASLDLDDPTFGAAATISNCSNNYRLASMSRSSFRVRSPSYCVVSGQSYAAPRLTSCGCHGDDQSSAGLTTSRKRLRRIDIPHRRRSFSRSICPARIVVPALEPELRKTYLVNDQRRSKMALPAINPADNS